MSNLFPINHGHPPKDHSVDCSTYQAAPQGVQFGGTSRAEGNLSYIPSPPHHDEAVCTLSAGNCTYCHAAIIPTTETPLIMCPFCGFLSNIRYCTVSCMLADSIGHSSSCMQYPTSQRLTSHELSVNFVHEQNPITSLNGLPDSPYRLRQKLFSLYCFTGQFPKLHKTWLKRVQASLTSPAFDTNESNKKTGEYAVFRSSLTGGVSRNNPDADVIFT